MNLESKIEALLFFKGEPMMVKNVAKDLDVKEDSVKEAIENLKNRLGERGLRIIHHDDKVMLGTAPEMSEFFEKIRKEELNRDLSKASLETLSIILYRNGTSRSEINYIRGVNAGFILRNLEVRGLVEKLPHPKDHRTFIYKPTLELLSFMGVSSVGELPKFEDIKNTLAEKLQTSVNAE